MDWRALILLAAVAGCGGHELQRSGTGRPLAPDATRRAAPTGMAEASVPARGVLSYQVALSDDGSRLVSVELATAFELVVRELDGRGRARVRSRLALGAPTYDIHDLAIDAAATRAWVASADGSARAVDLERAAVTHTWHVGDAVTAVAFTPRFVAVGTASGIVCLRRLRDRALLQCMLGHRRRVSALAFDLAGARLASSSWDGSVALWAVPSLRRLAARPGSGSVNHVAFDRAGKRLALARSAAPPIRSPAVAAKERHGFGHRARRARVEIWEPGAEPSSARETSCAGHRSAVTSVAFSADGRRLLSTSWDRTVILWEPRSCRQLARLEGFGNLVRDVDVDASGRLMAIAAWSRKLGDRATVVVRLLY